MISTTCETCKFRVMTDNKQTGCSMGILERFEFANAEITDRVCNENTALKTS